jgi:hypothetical protein
LQVHFLHEEEIVDSIAQAIQARLKGSNESRSFSVQPITSMMGFEAKKSGVKGTSGVLDDEEEETKRNEDSDDEEASDEEEVLANKRGKTDRLSTGSQAVELDLSLKPTPPSRKYQPSQVRIMQLLAAIASESFTDDHPTDVQAPQRLVRTDHRASTIDKFFFLDSQRSQPTSSQSPDQASQSEKNGQTKPSSHGSDDSEGSSPSDGTKQSRKRKLSEAIEQSSEGATTDITTLQLQVP